jgi:hypothetical protein
MHTTNSDTDSDNNKRHMFSVKKKRSCLYITLYKMDIFFFLFGLSTKRSEIGGEEGEGTKNPPLPSPLSIPAYCILLSVQLYLFFLLSCPPAFPWKETWGIKNDGKKEIPHSFDLSNEALGVGRDGTVGLDVVELGVGCQSLDAVVAEASGETEECRGVPLGDFSSCFILVS